MEFLNHYHLAGSVLLVFSFYSAIWLVTRADLHRIISFNGLSLTHYCDFVIINYTEAVNDCRLCALNLNASETIFTFYCQYQRQWKRTDILKQKQRKNETQFSFSCADNKLKTKISVTTLIMKKENLKMFNNHSKTEWIRWNQRHFITFFTQSSRSHLMLHEKHHNHNLLNERSDVIDLGLGLCPKPFVKPICFFLFRSVI